MKGAALLKGAPFAHHRENGNWENLFVTSSTKPIFVCAQGNCGSEENWGTPQKYIKDFSNAKDPVFFLLISFLKIFCFFSSPLKKQKCSGFFGHFFFKQ